MHCLAEQAADFHFQHSQLTLQLLSKRSELVTKDKKFGFVICSLLNPVNHIAQHGTYRANLFSPILNHSAGIGD